MKAVLLVICCGIIILRLSYTKTESVNTRPTNMASSGLDTLHFKTDIQPVLQKNCSPCHFPGGKMYERMPFDKGETIVNHESGVLKRFGDKKENELVKQFIMQSKLN